MRNHRTFSSWVAVSLVMFATLSARVARADDSSCQSDTDCSKGFSCQVTGGASCGGAPACPPGAACDPVPPCSTVVIKSCVPGPCGTDADCADGMLCHQSAAACPAIACPQDAACPPIACDPGPKQCTPKYQLPCTADADCGAGFSCVLGEVCSGTTTQADAGTHDVPSKPGSGGGANAPTDVTCMPATVGGCQLTPVTCRKDNDCQAGWSCLDVAAGYGCADASPPAMGSGANGSTDGGAPAPSSGGSSASDAGTGCPPPPAPMLQCTPPGYRSGYGNGAGVASGSTATASGGATSVAGATSVGAATSVAGAGSGLAIPSTPEHGATDSGGSTGPETSTSCAVSVPGGASQGGFALLALGLFGLVRRRRVPAR